MVKPQTVIWVSTAALALVASPVAACDLHGPGQLGGFHRYNPFASALQQYPADSAIAEDASVRELERVDDKANADKTKDARRRAEVLDDKKDRIERRKAEADKTDDRGRASF